MTKKIAIIGMSALFPQAKDLQQYWQNILDKKYCITENNNWKKYHFDPSRQQKNKIYNIKGGFLGDLKTFSPMEFGVMPKSIDGADPGHFLALRLAGEAIKDSGYDKSLSKKTGVIIGASFSSHRGMGNLMQHGLFLKQMMQNVTVLFPQLTTEQLSEIRQKITQHLPDLTPDAVPGSVHNLYAGRIANHFDLNGPNYVVDAACASSAIAIRNAFYELNSGQCETMLVGGVSATIDFMFSLLFSLIGALSPSKMRPFDARANGILLGEGLGFIVLKPYEKAVQDGDRIYATIRGVGCSSDGKSKGLFVPNIEGEKSAILRAYDYAQISPHSVSLIEAHGTGTPLGDPTEISALTQVFGKRAHSWPTCAIGSVKSMIAHSLAAGGIAGVIKMALALYHKVLPATICEKVNPQLQLATTPFYVNTITKMWVHPLQRPRRAGVNIFGFGGINAHIVLEEEPIQNAKPLLLKPRSTYKMFVFSAPSKKQLAHILQQHLRTKNFAKLSFELSQKQTSSHRLAIIAQNVEELTDKLNAAITKLNNSEKCSWQTVDDIYYSTKKIHGKIAFVFPGQTSFRKNMLQELGLHFPVVRKWFDFLSSLDDQLPAHHILFPAENSVNDSQIRIQQDLLQSSKIRIQSVFCASLGMAQVLQALGIFSDGVVGYSSGQYAALVAAGSCNISYDPQCDVTFLNDVLLASCTVKGKFFIVTTSSNNTCIQKILNEHSNQLVIAMDNCPNQIVLFAHDAISAKVETSLNQESLFYTSLDIRAPIHTKWYQFQHNYPQIHKYKRPLYSCCSANVVPNKPQEILKAMIREWSTTVQFRQTIENMYRDGYRTFIEVGPGNYATSFIRDTLGAKKDIQTLATDTSYQSSMKHLLTTLSRLYVSGISFDLSFLHHEYAQNNKSSGNVLDNSLPFVELTCSDRLQESCKKRDAKTYNAIQEKKIAMEKWPLLDKVTKVNRKHYIFSRLFSPHSDNFLYDHTFCGKASIYRNIANIPVLPLSIALEMIAEAVIYLTNENYKVAQFVDIHAKKWIFFENTKNIVVAIFEKTSNKDSIVFEAHLCELNVDNLRVKTTVVLEKNLRQQHCTAIDTNSKVKTNIYLDASKPCFQTPGIPQGVSFQRIQNITSISRKNICVTLKKQLFFHHNDQKWQLDVTAIDSCFSSTVLWSMHAGIQNLFFPVKIDKIIFFDTPMKTKLWCQTLYNFDPQTIFEFCDENGNKLSNDKHKEIPNEYFYIRLVSPYTTLQYNSVIQSHKAIYAKIEGGKLHFAKTPRILHRFYNYPHLTTFSEVQSKTYCRLSRSIVHYLYSFLSAFDHKRLVHMFFAVHERNWQNELDFAKLIVAKDSIRIWVKERLLLQLSPRDIDIYVKKQQLWGYCRQIPQFLFKVSIQQKDRYLYAYIQEKKLANTKWE